MSWLDKIHAAIGESEATGDNKIANDMFQACLSDMNERLQAVTNTIDPDDYAFFFVALRLAGRAIGKSLDPMKRLLAAMVEARTDQTIVTLPNSFRTKAGES